MYIFYGKRLILTKIYDIIRVTGIQYKFKGVIG